MNLFENLVPPNLDSVCATQDNNIAGVLQNSTTTCSSGWDYYKGYGFDIVIIVGIAWFVYKILSKLGRPVPRL
jgi:hypothetical protein